MVLTYFALLNSPFPGEKELAALRVSLTDAGENQRVTKERSKLRILAGREKPIDIIAKNLLLLSASRGVVDAAHADAVSLEEEEPELREPHTLFDGLADDALSQLRVR